MLTITNRTLAVEAPYYRKANSWWQTMIVSREALQPVEGEMPPGLPLPNLGKESFTLAAWIKTRKAGTVIAKAPLEGPWEPQGKAFFVQDGRPGLDVGWVGFVEAEERVTDGQWHHLALCKDRDDIRFFVDGRAAGRGDLRVGNDPATHVFKIGFGADDFPEPSGFTGAIDEVHIYGVALNASEVKAIMVDSGSVKRGLVGLWDFEQDARDVSAHGNHGTVVQATATEGRFGKALQFEGDGCVLLPADGKTARRNHIWQRIARDFPDRRAQEQIDWEKEDQIWEHDWEPGQYQVIALRYAAATRDIGGLAERARRQAADVQTITDLAKVRETYLLSRQAQRVYPALQRQMQLLVGEIDYLAQNRGQRPAAWDRYNDRVNEIEQKITRALNKLGQGDQSMVTLLGELETEVRQVHATVPVRLPSGPTEKGPFGAYHTTLKYSLAWDAPWRIGPQADVVVRFEDGGHRLVFWRGTSYIPCWVTENGIWYTNEFVERRGHHSPNTRGCVEPMSDKQCRFSRVRIIENTPARVVIHWRYAPVDVHYEHPFIDAVTGWGDWVDEYYTVYPDGVGVRHIVAHTSRPDLWMEFQESIVVNQPGTMPDDNIERGAVTLANLTGQSKTYTWTREGGPEFEEAPAYANIVTINLKAPRRPFAITAPPQTEGLMITPYLGHGRRSCFNWWDHWPVSQTASDGRAALSSDRPSHSSLCHIGLDGMCTAPWPDYRKGDTYRSKIMLHGLTSKRASELAALGRSWLQPAVLKLTGEGQNAYRNKGYDPTQMAYRLEKQSRVSSSPLVLVWEADKDSPLVNPGVVVKNWGRTWPEVLVNGRSARHNQGVRIGHIATLDGSDLVAWLRLEASKPTEVMLRPAGRGSQ
jgi:hypothetical protein